MASEVFPWNEWIRLLIGGDAAPFLSGLRRAVYGNRFLRGKSAEALRREYGGDDVKEEIVQDVFLKTLHLWDVANNREDREIAGYITTTITRALNDRYKQAQRERALFLSSDDNTSDESESARRETPDSKPTPEAEFVGKQFIESLEREMTRLQAFVLHGHQRFGLGPYSTQELASLRGVSIGAVEKQVNVVKRKVIEFVLKNGYLAPSGSPARDNLANKNPVKTVGKTSQVKGRR